MGGGTLDPAGARMKELFLTVSLPKTVSPRVPETIRFSMARLLFLFPAGHWVAKHQSLS